MMRWLPAALAGLAMLCAGCVLVDDRGPSGAPDRTITCDHFDQFQSYCTTNCSVTWDCERNYDSLDLGSQIALDQCSDCLARALSDGVCADCSVPDEGVGSCQVFMEDLLGINCW